MPVGRFSYKGSPQIGRTNPTALGTAATRLAAKAGLGGGSAASPDPADDAAFAKAFRIPKAKQTSRGRQNVAVVKQTPVKQAKAAAPAARTPKRKPA
jgi:hypothetical protein